jgi:hypothetical protein
MVIVVMGFFPVMDYFLWIARHARQAADCDIMGHVGRCLCPSGLKTKVETDCSAANLSRNMCGAAWRAVQ